MEITNKITTIFKKGSLLIISIFLIFSMFSFSVKAGNEKPIYIDSIWRVYLHSPNTGKPYYHLHFYKKHIKVYCLRLDNMQACDGTEKNETKVSEKVKKRVMDIKKVQEAIKYHNPALKISWIRTIIKPLLLVGAGILTVVAAVNIFSGPIDELAAYYLFMAIAGW